MTDTKFNDIFGANKDSVYSFAWRMTGSPHTAEDVAQDCFLELLKAPARYDEKRGPLRAWLLGVARNQILKRWRVEGRWTVLDEEACVLDPPSGDFRVDEKVAQAVQCLPPLQREVLILIEYEGLTLEEAADAVDAEIGTVKARLHRARSSLRRTLEPLRSAVHER